MMYTVHLRRNIVKENFPEGMPPLHTRAWSAHHGAIATSVASSATVPRSENRIAARPGSLHARLRPLEYRVFGRGGGGEHTGGEREADTPRARSPGHRHGIVLPSLSKKPG